MKAIIRWYHQHHSLLWGAMLAVLIVVSLDADTLRFIALLFLVGYLAIGRAYETIKWVADRSSEREDYWIAAATEAQDLSSFLFRRIRQMDPEASYTDLWNEFKAESTRNTHLDATVEDL